MAKHVYYICAENMLTRLCPIYFKIMMCFVCFKSTILILFTGHSVFNHFIILFPKPFVSILFEIIIFENILLVT